MALSPTISLPRPPPWWSCPKSHQDQQYYLKSSYMFVTGCTQTSIILDCFMNIQTNHLMIPILQFILKMCPTTTRFGHLKTSHNPLPNPPIILLPGHLRICWLTCWWTGWWQEVTWSLWERSVDWWRMWSVPKISILMNWPCSTLSGSSISWPLLKQLMPQILLLVMVGWNMKPRYLFWMVKRRVLEALSLFLGFIINQSVQFWRLPFLTLPAWDFTFHHSKDSGTLHLAQRSSVMTRHTPQMPGSDVTMNSNCNQTSLVVNCRKLSSV